MPVAQMPPNTAPVQLDRFVPAVQSVETHDYKAQMLRNLSEMRGQSAFLTIKYGLINAEQELGRISRMGPDWDSYGAEPPSAQAISAARTILAELAGALILPSGIVPSASGGVSIYFMKGDRTAYIENYNFGTQALVMYDRQGATEVLDVGPDIPSGNVSDTISRYLERT